MVFCFQLFKSEVKFLTFSIVREFKVRQTLLHCSPDFESVKMMKASYQLTLNY